MSLLLKLGQYVLHNSGYYLHRYKSALKRYQLDDEWKLRRDEAMSCSDNKYIPRAIGAGNVEGNVQIMHNGIKVQLGSYYGYGYTHVLKDNEGVHEPQEERVFQEVLKFISVGATMVELGAFWSFYSLWFQQQVRYGKSYMVEPEYLNLLKGKTNFKINGFKGDFTQAFVGEKAIKGAAIPTITIDTFMSDKGIERLNILHSDIQGYELEMLLGAKQALEQKKIDYLFISTHSNDLHKECTELLKKHGYEIIASADLDNSYSTDGVLVAKRRDLRGAEYIDVAQRN